jgi:hypothetical protein
MSGLLSGWRFLGGFTRRSPPSDDVPLWQKVVESLEGVQLPLFFLFFDNLDTK